MSNAQFAAATMLVLAAHLGALAATVLRKRGAGPVVALNAAVALAVLAYLGAHPRAFGPPLDGQTVALAAFEATALAMAAMAARKVRIALAASWLVFVVHFAASGLAVAFALLFKIDRLI
jgi:hypothetical protein